TLEAIEQCLLISREKQRHTQSRASSDSSDRQISPASTTATPSSSVLFQQEPQMSRYNQSKSGYFPAYRHSPASCDLLPQRPAPETQLPSAQPSTSQADWHESPQINAGARHYRQCHPPRQV